MNRKIAFFFAACLVSISLDLSATGTPSHAEFRIPAGVKADDMLPGTMVIKLKPEFRPLARVDGVASSRLNAVLTSIGATQIFKIFPTKVEPATERNASGLKMVDLSLIYEIHFDASQPIEKVVNAVLKTGTVVYAEPKYLPKPTFTPNDPSIGLQYHLGRVQAYAAWDLQQGDTNVVIGITDTGSDLDHPDLEPNLKYNYADPIDGIDNDNDGYTDNWRGWDLGENDNNPTVGINNHGSHVSGCAAGVTNNGIGGAATGFNCKFLPVKIANASGALTQAYEGITYAADHGCQIINCSWGGPGGSSFGQDVVDYVTINKNGLVVASAGNDNNENAFYPASYKYVLNVASTTNSDSKSSFSNFGSTIDVCAPGSNIYAAMSNNTYGYMSGTSMAGPVCAGAAAIVMSHFPAYNGLQVGERLRVTCDNIYTVPSNGPYQTKLGKGRINMFRALTETGPSIRMTDIVFADNNDNTFVIGDTVRITGNITNYLDPTTALDVNISTTSTWVNIIDNNTFVGALGTLATVDNNNDPFMLIVNPGTPQNHKVNIRIDFVDGSYTDFQMIELIVNVDYINITMNQVLTTNTSKGRLCYNGTGQTEGLGFTYNGENLTYETGLMIGQSSTKVSDNVRGATGTDNDFQSTQVIQKLQPAVQSEFDLFGKFNDNISASVIPVLVSHKSFSWSTPGDDKFHIFEYVIKNTGAGTLSNVWAGIFSDWDIQDFSQNKANENAALKMGYVYNTTATGLWAGIKVLTPTPFNHYAIDNVAGQGGVNMTDGYDTGEKYTTLSTARAAAGVNGAGNDVIDIVSTGPFTLAAGDSVIVAFALIAGDDLNDLNTSAVNAQIKYDGITTSIMSNSAGVSSVHFFPNPASGQLFITPGEQPVNRIEIMDVTGRMVISKNYSGETDRLIELNIEPLSPGSYLIKVVTPDGDSISKFIKE